MAAMAAGPVPLPPGRGSLLVATPRLLDPNFARTVILLLEHGPEGALGLVLNRPSDVEVDRLVDRWSSLAAEPARVFVGGPVGAGSTAIGLARTAVADPEAPPLVGTVAVVDLGRGPEEVPGVEQVRIYSGYAGWGPGQLEVELDEGSWLVLGAAPEDPLSAEPEALWRAVLRRQGGTVAWLANHPLDPSWN